MPHRIAIKFADGPGELDGVGEEYLIGLRELGRFYCTFLYFKSQSRSERDCGCARGAGEGALVERGRDQRPAPNQEHVAYRRL